MKILAVSDTIEKSLYTDFQADRFPKVDLVLSCGDLPPEYLSFLSSAFQSPLFYIRGNHDIRYEAGPPPGCTDVHDKIVRFGPINILGLEGSRWYNGGPNQYTENQMKKIIRGLRWKIWWRRGIDLVITHAPPRHVHDAEDRCHKGFKAFQWLITRYAPAYFLHGHIHACFSHPDERITVVGQTRVINTCGHYFFDIDENELVSKI